MTQPSDDELERRLRDVLHDRGLGVPAAADAIDRVHAGARRRQHRRTVAAILGPVVIIAAAAVAIGARPHDGSTVAANQTVPPTPTARPVGGSSTPTATPTASPAPSSSAPSAMTSQLAVPGSAITSAASTVTFDPVSVSAVSVNDYWVLGYTTAKSGSDLSINTTVMRTTNGGQSFTAVGSPDAPVAQAPEKGAAGGVTVSDIRFGDANNGWAYGGGLFQTTNGGASWTAATGITGDVVDLVASNGTAWAIVDTAPNANPDQFALYSTPYGSNVQRWAQVQLPFELGAVQTGLVDQDGTVTLLAGGPSRAGDVGYVLVGSATTAFTGYAGPCLNDRGGSLSNSKTGIWAFCPTGSTADFSLSVDGGRTWRKVASYETDPSTAQIGAISNTSAVAGDFTGLQLLTSAGVSAPVQTPPGGTGFSFIGFTNTTVGVAIAQTQSGDQLWRTTDGGQTWSVVDFGAAVSSAAPSAS